MSTRNFITVNLVPGDDGRAHIKFATYEGDEIDFRNPDDSLGYYGEPIYAITEDMIRDALSGKAHRVPATPKA